MTSSNEPGRMLGVDYGTRRVGLAISDDLGWTARPLEVVQRKSLDMVVHRIRTLVEEHEVTCLVVGVPYRLDGSTGPAAERALEFIETLRTALPDQPIVTRDEALTSYAADELLDTHGVKDRNKRKALRDAYAAAVILQDELNARSSDS